MTRILLQASAVPQSVIWWITPTYKMAKRVFWRNFLRLLGGSDLVRDANQSELRLTLHDGTTVSCMSAEHPDRMRGDELDLAIFDEYQDQPVHLFEEIVEPMLLNRDGTAWFLGTPKGQANSLFEAYRYGVKEDQNYDRDWSTYTLNAYDAGLIPAWKLDKMRARADRISPTKMKIFKREYLADWSSFRGQVFPGWDLAKASIEAPPKTWARCSAGIDWGYSDTHAGVVEVAVGDDARPRRGTWTAVAEEHDYGVPIESGWLPRIVKLWETWKFKTVWAPDDSPEGIDALRRASRGGTLWQTRPVSRRIDARINAMADYIETGRLRIVQRACPKVGYQIGSYQWKEDKMGRSTDKPVKADDDAVDALGHLLYGEHSRKLVTHNG